MTDHTMLAERYIVAWNETDPALRRTVIAQTWTEAAEYRDPMAHGAGHDGIDTLIAGVQARFPGFRFALSGTVDGYADRFRFCWTLASDGADPIVEGTDFALVAPDGRLATVTGFIDRMPAA